VASSTPSSAQEPSLRVVELSRGAFDAIAEEFGDRRRRPTPAVKRLLHKVCLGETVLDAGAGGGRHIPILAEVAGSVVAVDISKRMLSLCSKTTGEMGLKPRVHLLLCAVTHLPFREHAFTAALYSAVLHHLTCPLRGVALGEARRTLRPGSPIIAANWSRRGALAVRRDAQPLEGTGFQEGDYAVPWRHPGAGSETRFYHLFTAQEMRDELRGLGFFLEAIWEEGLNIVALLGV